MGDFGTFQWMVRVEDQLKHLTKLMESMMADLKKLQDDVAANTTVVTSAVTLLDTLAQMIRDNAADPVALEKLATDLETNSKALGEAVARNTPATPTP